MDIDQMKVFDSRQVVARQSLKGMGVSGDPRVTATLHAPPEMKLPMICQTTHHTTPTTLEKEPSCNAGVDCNDYSLKMPPSAGRRNSIKRVIAPTDKSRSLMRQMSALGMEDPIFGVPETVGDKGYDEPSHPSQIFDDMSLGDIPEGMRDMISVASDPTAIAGDGLDVTVYEACLSEFHASSPDLSLSGPSKTSTSSSPSRKQQANRRPGGLGQHPLNKLNKTTTSDSGIDQLQFSPNGNGRRGKQSIEKASPRPPLTTKSESHQARASFSKSNAHPKTTIETSPSDLKRRKDKGLVRTTDPGLRSIPSLDSGDGEHRPEACASPRTRMRRNTELTLATPGRSKKSGCSKKHRPTITADDIRGLGGHTSPRPRGANNEASHDRVPRSHTLPPSPSRLMPSIACVFPDKSGIEVNIDPAVGARAVGADIGTSQKSKSASQPSGTSQKSKSASQPSGTVDHAHLTPPQWDPFGKEENGMEVFNFNEGTAQWSCLPSSTRKKKNGSIRKTV